MKILLRLAAISAGSVALAAISATAPAAQPIPIGQVPLYDIVYYSDASMTVEVGRNVGRCYGGWGHPIWAGSSEFTSGQQTSFHSQEHVGWCTADGTIYF